MPHSLFELNEMSREQLADLAGSLDIKVTKKMNMEDIAFSILIGWFRIKVLPKLK